MVGEKVAEFLATFTAEGIKEIAMSPRPKLQRKFQLFFRDIQDIRIFVKNHIFMIFKLFDLKIEF